MLQDDLTSFYYPLPLCLRVGSLTQSLSTLDFISLAGACQGAALLRSPRLFAPSVEGGRTALAAAGTTENTCTVDRRKLGCTCARSAERQRIIGAEANRIAPPNGGERSNAATQGTLNPQAPHFFELETADVSLSLGVPKGPFSFTKENGPFISCSTRGAAFLFPLCGKPYIISLI